MPRLLLIFAALGAAYVFLNDANPRMIVRDFGLAAPAGGGGPVMGQMARPVAAGAVALAGRAGG
ncbi:MAG: hypothetical protein RLZZ528_54 [Pseudomonadota bacterium]|jgi:hypothetical protein